MLIEIQDYELDQLIDWHRDMKWTCSQKEDFLEAEDHKRRAEKLEEIKKHPPVVGLD